MESIARYRRSSRLSRLAATALLSMGLLMGAVGPLHAQNIQDKPTRQDNQNKRFSESTSVVVVEVPVQVVRDGKPVRGLTAADFELYQGREKQAITGFEVLDLADVPASIPTNKPEAVRQMPASARRRFVLLFDLGYSKPSSLTRAREAAKKLLRGSFHPSDLIAVAAYLPSQGPQLLLGFTPDRGQVEKAIDHLSPVQNHFASDPLLLAGGDDDSKGVQSKVVDNADAETAYAGREAFVSSFAAVERSEREKQRSTLAAFTRAVGVFAGAMDAVDGRKNVLLLSEGFDSALALGTTDQAEIQQMDTNSVRGDIWNVDNDQRYGNTKSGNDLEKMLEALRRADCVIQAIDVGGVRASGDDLRAARSRGADGLFVMANSTGGELYQNFNDLGAAMEKMLDRTSVTYVLSFQPDVKQDGEYHKIRVELKNTENGRAGNGRVVYRPGYFAPKPYGQRTAMEKTLQAAGQVVSGIEGGPVGLAVLAAPFKVGATVPGGDNKAYVPVVIEIDGQSLLAGSQGAAAPTEVYVYALDAKGAVQDFFTQTMGLNLAKVGDAVRRTGVKFFGDLDLAPGAYSIRVLVRNGQTGAAGMRVASLEVPAFSAQSAPVLLPPFFPEPAGRWLVVREAKVREGEVPYPFMAGDQPFIPASRPDLLPGQAVAVSLVGYRLGAGELTAQAMIMTADGKEAGEGKIEILGRDAATADGPDRLTATFRPPALQPGEYLLLVTVTNAQGGTETSVAPFVVRAAAGANAKGASG
jgi:VWFA-related protein